MALLASYALSPVSRLPLSQFLSQQVFSHFSSITVQPDPVQVQGFRTYLKRFREGLALEAYRRRSLWLGQSPSAGQRLF